MKYITYLSFEDLLEKHNEVIRKSGGVEGVFNENLLKGFWNSYKMICIIRNLRIS